MSSYYRRNEMPMFMVVICFIIIIFSAYVEGKRAISKACDIYEVTATVTDKCVKNYGKESVYLVFTKTDDGDIEVFEVTDSFVKGRFDSSDVYAGIEVGKKYTFTVGGDRNEVLSWYPNIYEYVEVE